MVSQELRAACAAYKRGSARLEVLDAKLYAAIDTALGTGMLKSHIAEELGWSPQRLAEWMKVRAKRTAPRPRTGLTVIAGGGDDQRS